MPASPPTRSRTRVLAIAVSLGVIAVTASYLGDAFRVYPSWLSVGDASVHVLTVLPTLLGLLVVGAWIQARNRDDSGDWPPIPAVVLAVVVLLSAAYAVVDLNGNRPGLYVSGLLPAIFGLVLALLLLGQEGVAASRRFRAG